MHEPHPPIFERAPPPPQVGDDVSLPAVLDEGPLGPDCRSPRAAAFAHRVIGLVMFVLGALGLYPSFLWAISVLTGPGRHSGYELPIAFGPGFVTVVAATIGLRLLCGSAVRTWAMEVAIVRWLRSWFVMSESPPRRMPRRRRP